MPRRSISTTSEVVNAGKRPAAKAAESKRSDVPAVEKALDVLELLSTAPQGLTMSEIATSLQRTMGEIYRIVVYINERGYIAQDPETTRHSLTLRLFELAHQNSPTNRLVKHALPILEALAIRCDQSCHLAVLYKTNVLILASAPSPRPAGYSVKSGAIFPLVETSSGPVILAHMSEEARRRVLDSLSSAERDVAAERIDKIARKGFDRRSSNMVHGILNLCAPVFDHAGVIASVTMGYINQVNPKTLSDESLEAVIAAARQLSSCLGANPATPRAARR